MACFVACRMACLVSSQTTPPANTKAPMIDRKTTASVIHPISTVMSTITTANMNPIAANTVNLSGVKSTVRQNSEHRSVWYGFGLSNSHAHHTTTCREDSLMRASVPESPTKSPRPAAPPVPPTPPRAAAAVPQSQTAHRSAAAPLPQSTAPLAGDPAPPPPPSPSTTNPANASPAESPSPRAAENLASPVCGDRPSPSSPLSRVAQDEQVGSRWATCQAAC